MLPLKPVAFHSAQALTLINTSISEGTHSVNKPPAILTNNPIFKTHICKGFCYAFHPKKGTFFLQ